MSSLADLSGVVDVVIGGDTCVHTRSAAAVEAGTGGALGKITVAADGTDSPGRSAATSSMSASPRRRARGAHTPVTPGG
ncbi:hypothetical protein [Kocuria sp. CPCC 205263]|uniref:hypothetical protein n=1 Tax=Kocuria sp. CPCC 205263 TaxID=3073555 RepID=UPI0034D739B0